IIMVGLIIHVALNGDGKQSGRKQSSEAVNPSIDSIKESILFPSFYIIKHYPMLVNNLLLDNGYIGHIDTTNHLCIRYVLTHIFHLLAIHAIAKLTRRNSYNPFKYFREMVLLSKSY
ncbi:MAG TPA: hypothetical protein VHP81_01745, partial [Lachnospiraceae bacterium]|nr:hypothetical protein [Lachnospiraceae bacterium]